MARQTAIPAMLFRGGTSRGPFFRAEDLPADPELRDDVLRAVIGSASPLAIDGVGGGHPLSSKVGIVGPSSAAGVDLDFAFMQLRPGEDAVQHGVNCGNMLAAVLPFALESGMWAPTGDRTSAVVRTLGTGLVAEATVRAPADAGSVRRVQYDGDTTIDGVPGGGSPISLMFRDTAGSVASSLLPTGELRDTLVLEGGRAVEATLMDGGQPLAMLRAADLGLDGSESPAELMADVELRRVVEELRLRAGDLMGLGDVTEAPYPKTTLLSPPRAGGALCTRSFIPRVVHESLGVLAAVTVATALNMPGTIAAEIGDAGEGERRLLDIEHPGGALTVDLRIGADGAVEQAGIVRTARLLMSGDVHVPADLWDGSTRRAERGEIA